MLALSQSAVSAALTDLEGQLGVQLFDRVGKRLVVNEHGRLLYPRALALLERALEIEQLFRGDNGAIRVYASSTIGNYIMPEIIAQLTAAGGGGDPAATGRGAVDPARAWLRHPGDCRLRSAVASAGVSSGHGAGQFRGDQARGQAWPGHQLSIAASDCRTACLGHAGGAESAIAPADAHAVADPSPAEAYF